MPTVLTLADLNVKNSSYWNQENSKLGQLLTDNLLLKTARRIIALDLQDNVPIQLQGTFQSSLERAHLELREIKALARRETAVRGGKSLRPNPVDAYIIQKIARNSSITVEGILTQMRHDAGPGQVIEEVDDECIHFFKKNGLLREIKITGLKDRVSRIRKKLRKLASR